MHVPAALVGCAFENTNIPLAQRIGDRYRYTACLCQDAGGFDSALQRSGKDRRDSMASELCGQRLGLRNALWCERMLESAIVTHETKQLLGVNCTVVHHQSFEEDVLVEATFD